MKMLLLTSTLLLSLLICNLAQAEGWGTIQGKFVVKGNIKGRPNSMLAVGPKGELKDVALWLHLPRGEEYPEPHSDYAKTANDVIEIKINGNAIKPYFTLLRTSQKVRFRNVGAGNQLLKIEGFANPPAKAVLTPNAQVVQTFPKDERVPSVINSAFTPELEGYLLIRESPYASISGDDGTFEIANVPAGTWMFQFWHPVTGYMPDLNLLQDVQNGRRGRYEIDVFEGGVTDLGEIIVPAYTLQ